MLYIVYFVQKRIFTKRWLKMKREGLKTSGKLIRLRQNLEGGLYLRGARNEGA